MGISGTRFFLMGETTGPLSSSICPVICMTETSRGPSGPWSSLKRKGHLTARLSGDFIYVTMFSPSWELDMVFCLASKWTFSTWIAFQSSPISMGHQGPYLSSQPASVTPPHLGGVVGRTLLSFLTSAQSHLVTHSETSWIFGLSALLTVIGERNPWNLRALPYQLQGR